MSIELLKKFSPKSKLDIEAAEVELVKNILLPDEIVNIDKIKGDLNEKKFFFPQILNERVYPGIIRSPFIRTEITNLTCGFYVVEILAGTRTVKQKDRRYYDETIDKDKSLIFWICYDHTKDKYFLKQEEDGFKAVYNHIEEALLSDEIIEIFLNFNGIAHKFLNKYHQSTLSNLNTTGYVDIFTQIKEKIEVLKEYFSLKLLLGEIDEDEYKVINKMFDKWNKGASFALEKIDEIFDFEWTPKQIKEEFHHKTNIVKNMLTDMFIEWDRYYYIAPGQHKVFRSFLEFDYQEQRATDGGFENNDIYAKRMKEIYIKNSHKIESVKEIERFPIQGV